MFHKKLDVHNMEQVHRDNIFSEKVEVHKEKQLMLSLKLAYVFKKSVSTEQLVTGLYERHLPEPPITENVQKCYKLDR